MNEIKTVPAPNRDDSQAPAGQRAGFDREAAYCRKVPPMEYGDFDLETIVQQGELSLVRSSLFEGVPRRELTPWLRGALLRARTVAFLSEKARSEFIVAPILLACRELVGEDCTIYSGIRLDVDAEKGLKGECDFILSRMPPAPILRAPLLILVEAKKHDIEEGLGQCAAQMVAARRFNETHKKPQRYIHGCVTTGESWQFLRLDGANLILDIDRYYLDNLEQILGILLAIMNDQG